MTRKRTILATMVALIGGATVLGCALAPLETLIGVNLSSDPVAPSALGASGTIEVEEIVVAAEAGGRVVEIPVAEGNSVERGSPLVRLDTALLLTQRDGARATVAQAEAAQDAAQAQLARANAGARPEELTASESALAAAKAAVAAAKANQKAAAGREQGAHAGVAAAAGQLAAATADLEWAQAQVSVAVAALDRAETGATPEEIAIAQRGVEAAKNLLWGAQAQRDGVCGQVGRSTNDANCDSAKAATQAAEEQVLIAELQLTQVTKGPREEDIAALRAQVAQAQAGVEAARATTQTTQANVDGASATVSLAQADVQGAMASLLAARARRDQAQAAHDLLLAGARSEDIDTLQAQVSQAGATLLSAQAGLSGAETQLDRMTVVAPVGGMVLDALIHVGELATPGAPLMLLADLDELTLTVFVPEADLGRVRLRQSVSVTVDSYDDAFAGRVTYIASRAEFTPKHVETREERIHMVFAVKIVLDNTDGRLLPGMPADVTFQSLE